MRFAHLRTLVSKTLVRFAHARTLVSKTLVRFAHARTLVSKRLAVVEDRRGISTKRKEESFGKLNKPLLLSTPSMKKGEGHENNLHWGHLNNSIHDHSHIH